MKKHSLPGIISPWSPDSPLKIGEIEIPCYVLEDETRVLSLRGLHGGIGMSIGGGRDGERKLAALLGTFQGKGLNINDLLASVNSPIKFRPGHGGRSAYGYEATILSLNWFVISLFNNSCKFCLSFFSEGVCSPANHPN